MADWRQTVPKKQKVELFRAIHQEMLTLHTKFNREDISYSELKLSSLAIINKVWTEAPSSDDFVNRLAQLPQLFFEDHHFAEQILQHIRQKHQTEYELLASFELTKALSSLSINPNNEPTHK